MTRRPRGSFPSTRPPPGSFPSYTDRPAGSFPTGPIALEQSSQMSAPETSSSSQIEASPRRPMQSSDSLNLEGRIQTPRKKKPKPSYSLGTKVKIFRSCLRRRVHPFASQVVGSSGPSIGTTATTVTSMYHPLQQEDQMPLMDFMDEYEDLSYESF